MWTTELIKAESFSLNQGPFTPVNLLMRVKYGNHVSAKQDPSSLQIFQKEERHYSVFWKAFQIHSNYYLSHEF